MRMLSLSIALVILAATSTPSHAQKQFGFDNKKSSSQPYMTPLETVAKFKVPPEFEVKLFAGEPDVVNPIAFTIDEKGRVWVVECFEYPSRAGKKVPRDRIVILEDTDGDGTCDKRTVFAEGKDFPVTEERKKAGLGAFDMASGIEVGHGGVFIGAPPYLWFIENKNDKPGKFEVLLKGFGSEDTHETLNTFQWGPDGWLYGLHGIYTQSNIYNADPASAIKMNAAVWRYHPRTKKFEIFAEGTSNPWGMDWRNTDGQFILACCVIPHLYHIVPGGIYRRQGGVSNNPYAYGYIQEICDHTFHKESGWAHAGLISLDVPHMPEKYRSSVIFGSIHGCSLKQNILKPNGSSYTASRGDDFLQSGDKNVRPINLRWGPLGDIYMIDWHDQNPCHQAAADSWDYTRGRVYRIQLKGTQPKKTENMGALTGAQLSEIAVYSPDVWQKRTAMRLLADRGDGFTNNKKIDDPYVLRTLFATRGSMDKLRKAENAMFYLFMLAGTDDPATEGWICRFLSESDGVRSDIMKNLLESAATTKSPVVRRDLASAAARMSDRYDIAPLLRALMSRKEDAKDPLIPNLVWIAYERTKSWNSPMELEWLAKNGPKNEFITDHIIPRVTRRIVASDKRDALYVALWFVLKLRETEGENPSLSEKALLGIVTELNGRTVEAPEGWAKLRDDLAKEPKLLPLVNKLAVSFRDPAAVQRAIAAAKDVVLSVGERIEAVKQIATLKPKDADTSLLLGLVRDPQHPVRVEAVRALAAFDSKAIPDSLLTDWPKHPKELHPEIINTLATRKEWAKALLTAMQEKKIDRAAVSDNTILRIQAFKDKELDSLIEKAWGRTRATPAELAAIIDKTRASLATGEASFARGRLVFDNHCAKCHKFDGRGSDVGPALDGAARDIDYIVTNVLDPNRVIGAPYFLRIARTADGRVEQGVLAEEDDRFVTLKLENGVLKKLAKADLEGPLQVVEKSLMPEGLTGGMKPAEFADLIRYLMAHPFVTHATMNGLPTTTSLVGRFTLPGGKSEGTVIEAEVLATEEVKTQLLLGSSADYEIKLDGQPVAVGPTTARPTSPDQASHAVTLAKGNHRLTLHVKDKGTGGTVYVRFLDPDRKLQYVDPHK